MDPKSRELELRHAYYKNGISNSGLDYHLPFTISIEMKSLEMRRKIESP